MEPPEVWSLDLFGLGWGLVVGFGEGFTTEGSACAAHVKSHFPFSPSNAPPFTSKVQSLPLETRHSFITPKNKINTNTTIQTQKDKIFQTPLSATKETVGIAGGFLAGTRNCSQGGHRRRFGPPPGQPARAPPTAAWRPWRGPPRAPCTACCPPR